MAIHSKARIKIDAASLFDFFSYSTQTHPHPWTRKSKNSRVDGDGDDEGFIILSPQLAGHFSGRPMYSSWQNLCNRKNRVGIFERNYRFEHSCSRTPRRQPRRA
jgi:hypothetical protein